ncbi:MAG: ATP-binding cassette domain-containing protein [Candidatus Coprovivens sp.]
MAGIKIKKLKFSYDNINVFSNLNFILRKGQSLSIIGPSGSGKTTLLKLFNGDLNYEGELSINSIPVCEDNFDKLKNNISVIFRDSNFLCQTVKEELSYILEQNNISSKEIKNRIDEIDKYFNIKKILNKNISDLCTNDQYLIKILSYAIIYPTYLAIDDLFLYLNNRTEILLLNYLNSNNITLINVTSDMEDVLYTDYILCLYDGISAIDGKTLDVLSNEKILKRLGFSLPFMVDLSIQLQAYDLISKMYLNKEVMVKNLWK